MADDKVRLFPSEDTGFGGSTLFVDLVPSSSWGENLRSLMTASKWKSLAKLAIDRAGGRCEICHCAPSSKPKNHIECHERWAFDPAHGTQTLIRLVALCSRCHRATHFGFAQAIGRGAAALAHLKKVNSWSDIEAKIHVNQAFAMWEIRSQMPWALVVDNELVSAYFKQPLPPNPYSPCVNVCKMADGLCRGCGRSLEQISAWSSMSLHERRATTSLLRERRDP